MSDFIPARKVAVSSSATALLQMPLLSPFGKLSPRTSTAIEIRLDLRDFEDNHDSLGLGRKTSLSKMGDNGAKPSGTELEKEPPFPLTEVDKWVLSQTDEEFHLHDWEELRGILGGYEIYLLVCYLRIVGFANREGSFRNGPKRTMKSSASHTLSSGCVSRDRSVLPDDII